MKSFRFPGREQVIVCAFPHGNKIRMRQRNRNGLVCVSVRFAAGDGARVENARRKVQSSLERRALSFCFGPGPPEAPEVGMRAPDFRGAGAAGQPWTHPCPARRSERYRRSHRPRRGLPRMGSRLELIPILKCVSSKPLDADRAGRVRTRTHRPDIFRSGNTRQTITLLQMSLDAAARVAMGRTAPPRRCGCPIRLISPGLEFSFPVDIRLVPD